MNEKPDKAWLYISVIAFLVIVGLVLAYEFVMVVTSGFGEPD